MKKTTKTILLTVAALATIPFAGCAPDPGTATPEDRAQLDRLGREGLRPPGSPPAGSPPAGTPPPGASGAQAPANPNAAPGGGALNPPEGGE